ncbi:MAG: DNA cytosine methyltransferase [Gammaproteobacteria bacterium]|nr:DNA cytosine methyltransferase [Gammaproteobacteria bacterium]MDE0252471.1 DNA cytosine methyltransferase [Gammaproteobacteria bacterium]MDE0402420.1 DNA cytosine methyltransferase [Gammaproteobacteria bacterium]
MKNDITHQPNTHISAFDVFCGVGGLAYGLRSAGINIVGGLDIDKTCEFAFEHNCSAPFFHTDVAETTFGDIASLFERAKYRILVGCAPCQPFSAMSNSSRKEVEQMKWSALPEFSRLISEGQPHVVFMENVPRLQRHEVFTQFLNQLKSNDYKVTMNVVNCSDYGVPQTRRRLVLLASKLGKINIPTKVSFIPTVRETIEGLPQLRNGEHDPSDPLHQCSKLSTLNLRRIRASTPGGSWNIWPTNLRPECYLRPSGKSFHNVYGRMKWDTLSPTLTTQFFRYGTGRFGHPEQDRALSLREGALLQTFPYTFKFVHSAETCTFTRVGAHIGNAVPPQLALIFGREIIKHIEEFGE